MAEDREVEGKNLGAIVAAEIRAARGFDNNELADKRSLAVEYMRGEMSDLPARPGGSSLTSRDFPDTVSWILPGVVRVFTASDQMVQYDKVREENDDWSRDATEYTNYSFFRENDGYRLLYNASYDGLTLGNGLACSYWEPQRITTKWFRNQTEVQIAALMQEEGWQPTGAVKPGVPQMDDETGIEVPTLSVKMMKEDRAGRICDVTCKPENLFLNTSATTIEDARFVAYLHDDKTRSDLMDMARDYGWDTETIRNLPSFSRASNRSVTTARDSDVWTDESSPVKSGDLIDLYECYMRADLDGDGIAELVQCWFAGDTGSGAMLGEPEEYEGDVPFTDIPCYPVPHRWDAQSVFDRTSDIQKAKTVLLRQAADNLYATNLPMREVEAGSVENPDILVNPKFGGIIWRKKNSTTPIVPHAVPFVADKAFTAMQYLDEIIAKRTGVSRSTMALDPEALQNQTATAAQQQRDAGYSQIELIARNMAELGWSKFFAKRLKLAVNNGLVRKIPSKSEEVGFREVDASKWDPSMAVTINVGLGTGSRDRDMAMLNQIMMGQVGMADRLGAAGLTSKAIEFLPRIRNTAVKMAESSGLKNPEEFYPEVTDEEVEQFKAQAEQAAQQPDPKIQLEQQKAEADMALQQQKTQADAMRSQQELQLKREQIAAEMQLKREQLAAELQLKREQMAAELALQRELGHANVAAKAANIGSNVRPGGEPG